jgi:ankyrin repeat protein
MADCDGNTFLHHAARNDVDLAVIANNWMESETKNDVALHQRNQKGRTPMQEAMWMDHIEALHFLASMETNVDTLRSALSREC